MRLAKIFDIIRAIGFDTVRMEIGMAPKFKVLKSLFIFSVLCFFVACASDEKNANTAEALFKDAQEYADAERYDVAIQKYADVKNKFPYSALATEAELAVADLHFKRESFPEAQISYQNFRDLHPKHPRIDYVIFRAGLSFFMQLPDSTDRDLTVANDAIYHFNEVIKNYPASTHLKEAKENREKAFVMLAEKEIYIADFYLRQEKYQASLARYENVLANYSGYGLDPKALSGAVKAATKSNDDAKRKKYLDILTSKYGNSDEAKRILDKDDK